MWSYFDDLPVSNSSNMVTLGEGNTPICRLRDGVYLKLEHLNPSGSYKDRFASCGLSWMRERGLRRCIATSSGNTGAALAAYCARAGVACQIYLVETTPNGKLVQMAAHGAILTKIRGFGLSADVTARTMERLRRLAAEDDSALMISAFAYSPAAMEGVKTIVFELVEQVPEVDDLFVPVGGGGLLTAVFRGFQELLSRGRIERLPRLHAVQPEGCATVAGPLQRNRTRACEVFCVSAISGLQVPNVIDGDLAIDAVRRTSGTGQLVSDAAIYDAQRRLAAEGIFSEPAGAAAYAGFLQARDRSQIENRNRVACLVTGHGLKDPESAWRHGFLEDVPLCSLEEAFESATRKNSVSKS